MAQVLVSNLERDGEQRAFTSGKMVVGSAGAVGIGRARFEPGWRWSKDVAPIAGTRSCEIHHLGYVLSGQMHIVTDDGVEYDVGAGDMFDLAPGHDAFIIGDVACDVIDISPDVTRYAKGATKAAPQVEDRYLSLVRKGYAAFNTGDIQTLVNLMSHDVVQHVPGTSVLAGDYKGIDAVLGYYAKLGELTAGTMRAHLVDVHGDGHGHVVGVHQTIATRNGVTRVSRGSIVFTFLGDKATDLAELHSDLAGDDAFLA